MSYDVKFSDVTQMVTKADRTYKSPKAIIKHARDLIADQDRWIQEALEACSKNDEHRDNATCKFCAVGAIAHFTAEEVYEKTMEEMFFNEDIPESDSEVAYLLPAVKILDDTAAKMGFKRYSKYTNTNTKIESIVSINDGAAHKTLAGAHAATLRVFDQALADLSDS